MKKENISAIGGGLTAVLMVNAVVFSVIAFNKKYKPFLDKMADQYGKLKSDNKTKSSRKTVEYKAAAQRIFQEAKKELEPLKELAQEVLKSYSVQEVSKQKVISDEVHDFLLTKFEKIETGELIPRTFESPAFIKRNFISENNFQVTVPVIKCDWNLQLNTHEFSTPAIGPASAVLALPTVAENSKTLEAPVLNGKWVEKYLTVIALIVALNSFGSNEIFQNTSKIASEIIEDLEDFFTPEEEMDLATYSDNLVHSVLPAEPKVNEILSLGLSYEEKFNDILAIEGISLEEKIGHIIHSDVTSYENVFTYLFNQPQISFDSAMQNMIHSDITHYTNIFNFILKMDSIGMDIKMYYIFHSGLTDNSNIFKFVFSMDGLNFSKKMEYIITSGIATYEELFELIHQLPELSEDEKIWYTLLIPNQPFENTLSDLLTTNSNQEEVIKSIIKADIIPFRTLFDNILELEGMNGEKLTKYLLLYNSDYNDIKLEAMGRYVFETSFLTEEEKIDCVWGLMEPYSLEEKEILLQNFYQTDYFEYLNLLRVKPKKLNEQQVLFMKFYEKVMEEKEKFVLENYPFESESELIDTIAGCAAEGCFHYDDLYAVANTIFNRTTHPYYAGKHGANPYSQFIAPGQFSVYASGKYKLYIDSKKFDYSSKYAIARCAFLDMFYANYEGIKHNFVEFRSSGTVEFSNNIFVANGNRYGNEMSETIRIKYDNLVNSHKSQKEVVYVYASTKN